MISPEMIQQKNMQQYIHELKLVAMVLSGILREKAVLLSLANEDKFEVLLV